MIRLRIRIYKFLTNNYTQNIKVVSKNNNNNNKVNNNQTQLSNNNNRLIAII